MPVPLLPISGADGCGRIDQVSVCAVSSHVPIGKIGPIFTGGKMGISVLFAPPPPHPHPPHQLGGGKIIPVF
jgi:hypothetical protein